MNNNLDQHCDDSPSKMERVAFSSNQKSNSKSRAKEDCNTTSCISTSKFMPSLDLAEGEIPDF